MAAGSLTFSEALSSAQAELAHAGCGEPERDAQRLLEAVLKGSRRPGSTEASLDGHAVALDPDAAERFRALVERRAAREPLAYVVGFERFRGLELHVDERVLVPRPHTEALVEAALELPRGARVLDVCTGSGAVALALKDERPDLDVRGSDLSKDALAVARANAARLGLEVAWHEADLLGGTAGSLDAVLANPPYMPESDPAALSPELAGHEPGGAFMGGANGLDLLRRIVRQAAGVPFLALEVGDGQAPAVAALIGSVGFSEIVTRRDFTGAERVVVGLCSAHTLDGDDRRSASPRRAGAPRRWQRV